MQPGSVSLSRVTAASNICKSYPGQHKWCVGLHFLLQHLILSSHEYFLVLKSKCYEYNFCSLKDRNEVQHIVWDIMPQRGLTEDTSVHAFRATVAQVVEWVGLCSEDQPFDPRPCKLVSLGKTLNPPCLVWMCMTAVCLRLWSEGPLALNGSHASISLWGSCGYYCSLPPPEFVNEWNLEPCEAHWVSRKRAIQIRSLAGISLIAALHRCPAAVKGPLLQGTEHFRSIRSELGTREMHR